MTGVRLGTTAITAVYDTFSATAQVNVKPALVALSMSPTSTEMNIGQTSGFTVTATYADNKTENVTAQAEWSTSDASVASVSAGLVSGLKAGAATVTASFQGQTAQAGVRVWEVVVPPQGPVVEITAANETEHHELSIIGTAVRANHVLVTLINPNNVSDAPHTVSVSTNGSFTFTSGTLSEGEWKYKVEAVKDGVTYSATAKTGTVIITVTPNVPPTLSIVSGHENVVNDITDTVVTVMEGKRVGELRSALAVAGGGTFSIYTDASKTVPSSDTELATNAMVIITQSITGEEGLLYSIALKSDTDPPVLTGANIIYNNDEDASIELVYNEALDENFTPDKSDFTIESFCGDCYGGYRGDEIESVEVKGFSVLLHLHSLYDLGSPIRTSYTPGNVPLRDLVGNFAGRTVEPVMVNERPTVEVNIEGVPEAGKTLTGSFVYHDAEGDSLASVSYEWYRGESPYDFKHGELIPNATSNTYTLTAEDQGGYIFFVVYPTASSGSKKGEPGFRGVGIVAVTNEEDDPIFSGT